MISRELENRLKDALSNIPAVALLGSRQVGKTTLALKIAESFTAKKSIYLDLESDADRSKLLDAEAFLKVHFNELIIIDEVQQMPDLFRTLRVIIDQRKRAGEPNAQFLLLGSASRDLLNQSSETLAGRILYLELTPFSIKELVESQDFNFSLEKLWLRGGYPDSFLANSENVSWDWRTGFISTYVERDIPRAGLGISPSRMRNFWTMLAHLQGQQLNLSALGKGLDVSHTTTRNYLDILTELFMVRQLPTWSGNTKKRLVKSPKVYIRDSGILHRLLMIQDFQHLLGHPVVGYSWEGFVIENILNSLSDQWQASYYRSAEQTEIDLILEKGNEIWAIEIKRNLTPKVPVGFIRASEDIKATRKFLLYNGTETFPMNAEIEAMGILEFLKLIEG
ncbi:MAG: ATP-binding protein [Cytophagaceae bacterium]|nr:ATP-binding protein [Cytophagaceae bacterium]MBK9933861.1 ATP-binding protein [Cytophagaceae bacterium]MBL0302422.1 ATP-binding protein [Cytophagaceae bacterium]MBL0325248.1 ATP-binding protein [Cytophagaceae bacterium]